MGLIQGIKKLWRSLHELLVMYRTYRIWEIYKPYTIFGIKHTIQLLKMYRDKENIG
jgi:hypothetical protein